MKAKQTRYTAWVDPLRRRLLTQWPLLGAAAALGVTAEAASLGKRVLDAKTTATLAAWAETLVPGAAAAGAADFVAAQLARPRHQACLTLRYLDWPGSFADFYRQGIGALDRAAQAAHGKHFVALDAAVRGELAGKVAGGALDGWQGPPSGLFYFATRADAVDVVYGTVAGFARLGVPYRAHIAPQRSWPGEG